MAENLGAHLPEGYRRGQCHDGARRSWLRLLKSTTTQDDPSKGTRDFRVLQRLDLAAPKHAQCYETSAQQHERNRLRDLAVRVPSPPHFHPQTGGVARITAQVVDDKIQRVDTGDEAAAQCERRPTAKSRGSEAR